MERNFYNEDLENLLKENADEFKMSPSKKVWHGIYNDLHPGRRWPSIAMSLLFIFTLVIIGHLNTQQSQRSFLTDYQKGIELQKNIYSNEKANFQRKSEAHISQKITSLTPNTPAFKRVKLTDKKPSVSNKDLNDLSQTSTISDKSAVTEEITEAIIPDLIKEKESSDVNVIVPDQSKKSENNSVEQFPVNQITNTSFSIENFWTISNSPASSSTGFAEESAKNKFVSSNINEQTKTSAENKSQATHVPVLKIHRNAKITWSYYLSPTISYRYFSKTNNIDQALAQQLSLTNSDINRAVVNKPSIGLEVGTAMKYALSKKLKFTSGFQVNYSTYLVQANNIHPIIANLLLYNNQSQSSYAVSSISYYGNGPGIAPVNLRNYSLQISVPLGLEYKLAGNDNVQLVAASSFQPSFVVANRAYILSADKKNYVNQSVLSRQWNVTTNFGTFISFNSNKLNWQIGPQVHYQLLSSYHNIYQVREHYVDYGIRLGVSKLFK